MNQRFAGGADVDAPVVGRYGSDIVARNHVDVIGAVGAVRGDVPCGDSGSGRALPVVRDEQGGVVVQDRGRAVGVVHQTRGRFRIGDPRHCVPNESVAEV